MRPVKSTWAAASSGSSVAARTTGPGLARGHSPASRVWARDAISSAARPESSGTRPRMRLAKRPLRAIARRLSTLPLAVPLPDRSAG